MTLRRDGYLWLGTRNGLVRFDGIRFTVFDQHNTPGLNNSSIVFLFEDSRTNLWIGTEIGGIALLKPDGSVRSLDIGRGSFQTRLVSASEDSGGAVWLYTADGQLCRYRNESGRMDVFQFGADSPSFCRKLVTDGSTVWIGLDWGLYGLGPTQHLPPQELPNPQVIPFLGYRTGLKLDFLLASQRGGYWRLAEGRIQHWSTNHLDRDLGSYPWTTNTYVWAACEDRDGNLIVGTSGLGDKVNDGIYWFGADGKAAHIWHEQGLSHDGILSLAVDREGALWVGTDGGGLNRVKRNRFEIASAAREGVVQSMSEGLDGGLWIAFAGGGVTYLKGSVAKNFGASEGLLNTNIWSVFADKNQRVWVGSEQGLFAFDGKEFKQPDKFRSPVHAIHQDGKGQLWFGTESGLMAEGGAKPLTTEDGLSANTVRAIADDAEGNLWVGTIGGGLSRLRDGKFVSFGRKDGLPSEDISSLLVDSDGVLWIGTFGGGLVRFHQNKFTAYSTSDGLISNSIGYLIEDSEGYLWMGSNLGLMRVPKKALNEFAAGITNYIPCRTYDKADGLPASECAQGSQPAAVQARDGKLWFATTKGLVGVNPAQLKPNSFAPPVVIESVVLAGKPQRTNALRADELSELVIQPGQEGLEIRYTSLNLASAERARFKYRMEGHETAWTDARNSREARYPKLPAGKYRFHVIAANEDGLWNEAGASFAVTVLPPFWRTWWFLTITGIVLVALIVGVVHYVSTQKLQRQLERLRQQEALEKERSRIARDLHDQLGANLTQVALLGELAESDKNLPHEVEAHAKQISETARETTRALDEIVWAANPSNDTLEGLVTYACRHAQEFLAVAGLRYRLDVPGNLPDATIPPEVRHNVFLAFKESITNVVKHAHATEVCVRLRLQTNSFMLEVEDNGRGITAADEKSGRSGLRNMSKRMEDVHGEFSISPGTGGGTIVRLTVPFEKAKRV